MHFRIVVPIIRAGVWLAGGIFLLQMAALREGASADRIRFTAYLAFLMVLWSLLSAFIAARKIKTSTNAAEPRETPDH